MNQNGEPRAGRRFRRYVDARRRVITAGGAVAIVLASSLFLPASSAEASPVCANNRYGTPAQALAIETTQMGGSVAEAVAALRAAQATRGAQLGCGELDTAGAFGGGSFATPTLGDVRQAWEAHRASASQAASHYDACPAIGRRQGAYALGGWSARSAGLSFLEQPLAAIALNFVSTQYTAERTPGEMPTWPGLFAYSTRLGESGDACEVPGVVGGGVVELCGAVEALCPTYRSGRFSGDRFVVGDFWPSAEIRNGGAGFDQGWAGVMMIEAAREASDPAQAAQFRTAALQAADWAAAEPAVRNHNYTAKLIWLLAAAYEWTGEPRYRQALVDKLERNLLPAVLMDQDSDGIVDGVPGVPFATLVNPAARTPGRLWDAHNALPWYQAMNAWALSEAAAAFRSRGDHDEYARVRPYAVAVLDNLSAQVVTSGGGDPSVTGAPNIAYALAHGLYVLADPEGLLRPDWERALWSYWNAGIGKTPGELRTAIAALVTARMEKRPWRSWRDRAPMASRVAPFDSRISGLWYDPKTDGEGLSLIRYSAARIIAFWFTYQADGSGRPLWLEVDGTFDGEVFSGKARRAEGPRFGQSFDPGKVNRIPWGDVSIHFASCSRAILEWSSLDPAYGTGVRVLERLAGVDGLGCPPDIPLN